MGIFSSKIDVKLIEEIETDVVHLIIRLKEQEGQLDSFIKKCLLQTLQVYTNRLEKEENKRYVSKHKIRKIQELLTRTTCKLKEFSFTDQNQPETFFTVGKQLKEIKNYLFEIDGMIKTNKFSATENDNLLRTASGYFFCLVSSGKTLEPNEIDQFSILILKLYLKSSITNMSTIVDKNFISLKKIVEDLGSFSTQNLNSSNVKEITPKIKEIISNANTLIVKLNKESFGEENKHLSFNTNTTSDKGFLTSPSLLNNQEFDWLDLNLLKKVKHELNECQMVLDNVSPPIGEKVITMLGNKVKKLIYNELHNLCFCTKRVIREKQDLEKQGLQILKKLKSVDNENKEISEHLEYLKAIGEKITAVLESDTSFHKIKSLELLRKNVNAINTSNNEVYLQKVEILNRLTGYIVLDSVNYLRQMKKTVDTYKVYAREFPFSSDTTFYQNKVREMFSLKECINNLPKENRYINYRIGVIHKHLDEALLSLEIKAKHNQNVILHMKNLDCAAVSLTDIGKTDVITSLNKLNAVRRNISFIKNFHKLIILKKTKIYSKIQEIEEKLYETMNFPKVLRDIKTNLNEYEIRVETFVDEFGSDSYNLTKNKILVLLNRVNNREDYINFECKKVLANTIEIILDILTKRSKENDKRNIIKEQLNKIEKNIFSCSMSESKSRSEDFFKSQRQLLDSLKLENHFDELLSLKHSIQSRINIEEAKLIFWIFEKQRHELEEKINITLRSSKIEPFEELFNELFFIKDSIDDMPEGDAELDSFKQQFLTRIHNMLITLDADVGSAAMKQKQSENIVDLQNRFHKFEMNDVKISRSSMEFIQIIRRKAESFEEYAKYYMGSSYSVDYYVIHENLLRLLEELDRVECVDDELIKETVEAMNYIKDLLEILSSNASFEVAL